jgi:oligopeptide/dipeptide ABC transporter ATP-binding protein
LACFLRGFFKQLDAKMAQAGGVEFFEKSSARLRGRVEERVAAAHIGSERVLHSHAIAEVDTDRFGAFSGEVQRTTDPLTACIAKARHGAEVSGMDLVIASEGSFGPYPPAPFVTCNEEWLVLLDTRDDTVFHQRHVSLRTVSGGEACTSRAAVTAFAERMQFPEHQLVLRPREHWRSGDRVVKGIANAEQLHQVAEELIATHGTCWVETDLRAMANPTRMAVIAETADRVAVMYAGRIAEIGPVRDVIKAAKHPYTEGLMASIPKVGRTEARLAQIDGAMPRLDAIPKGCAFNPRCTRVFERCRQDRPEPMAVGASRVACWLYDPASRGAAGATS